MAIDPAAHLGQVQSDRFELGAHQSLERFIPDPDGPHLDLYLPIAAKRP